MAFKNVGDRQTVHRGTMNPDISPTDHSPHRFSGKQIVFFVGFAVLDIALVTTWWVNQYLYAATFEPIRLTETEQYSLNSTMAQSGQIENLRMFSSKPKVSPSEDPLEPEPYQSLRGGPRGVSPWVSIRKKELHGKFG
jgi:hypothetical protein